MKKLILILLTLIVATGFSVNANAYITNNTIEQAIINHNYLNMHYRCQDNNLKAVFEAGGAAPVIATQFGELNTNFLENLGMGVEMNISYKTMMLHANTFICQYLKNDFNTKARLVVILAFKPNLYVTLNMEQFVKQNMWILTHITPNVIVRQPSALSRKLLTLTRKINILLFKDIMFGKYRQAQEAIDRFPLRNALIEIWNWNYNHK